MGLLIRLLLTLLLAAWLPEALAAQVAFVLSDDSKAFQDSAETAATELRNAGHRVETFILKGNDPPPAFTSHALIVTFGSRAAQVLNNTSPRSLLLHTLLPRSAYERLPTRFEDNRKVSAVFIDQPVGRQLELLRIALPDWPRAAVLTSRDSTDLGRQFQQQAKDRRLRLHTEQVNDNGDVYPALQRLLAEPSVLIATPDSSLFNNRSIPNILLTAYHQHSPVMGFSPAYVKAGALLALYSTPAQLGQQTGEMARQGLSTGSFQPPSAPRHFRVGVNNYVARALGLNLDDETSLTDKLERSEGSP
ncbi:MAG: hypothetical protein LWW92_02250 [Rhodocyclales bacterium]|nr:hypothetical protein [Rhodocyclales bacterium]